MSRSPASLYNDTARSPTESSFLLNKHSSKRSKKYQRSASTSVSAHTPLASPTVGFSGSVRRAETAQPDEYYKNGLISGTQLRLKNVGSVARDHLSSERTFLSYVRTSLALSSAGIALMQFLYLGSTTKFAAASLGAILIVLALLVLFIGARRFFLVQRTLITGYFPASTFEIAVISFFLGTLITVTFSVILLGRSK